MKKDIFNFGEIQDFDKHINLSIPNYTGLIDIATALYYEYMHPYGKCLDIGCSTGNLLNNLPKIPMTETYGCDVLKMSDSYKFNFIQDDAEKVLPTFDKLDVIFSIFTLQFLGKHKRDLVIEEIKKHIDNGAVFIVAEKVYSKNVKVDTIMRREHIQQKRKGFTSDEILDKDYQLFGSMYCNSTEEMMKELDYLGDWEQIWQSYNFKGWIVC